MNHTMHTTIVNFIWGITDDVLQDIYTSGKYRDVIPPMTAIRHLDAVLDPTKQAVLNMNKQLTAAGLATQPATLANTTFFSRAFDFMPSSPSYGKSSKTDIEPMGSKNHQFIFHQEVPA